MEDLNIIYMPCHPTNQWSRQGTAFQYIVMHYVGSVSGARDNGRYFANNSNLRASAHFFVDEHDIVSSCPLTMAAGHCGVDYSGGKAKFWNGGGTNRRSIGIEMCCKKDSKGRWYIEPETVTRTVALVKWLMQEFNIPADHVIRHYDVCWKNCPEPWVRDVSQWNSFKQRISKEEIDMSEEKLREIIREEIKKVAYGDIKDIPDWWEGQIQQLLKEGSINGGTPEEVNATDVNLTYTEAKICAIMVKHVDKRVEALLKQIQKMIKEG